MVVVVGGVGRRSSMHKIKTKKKIVLRGYSYITKNSYRQIAQSNHYNSMAVKMQLPTSAYFMMGCACMVQMLTKPTTKTHKKKNQSNSTNRRPSEKGLRLRRSVNLTVAMNFVVSSLI